MTWYGTEYHLIVHDNILEMLDVYDIRMVGENRLMRICK